MQPFLSLGICIILSVSLAHAAIDCSSFSTCEQCAGQIDPDDAGNECIFCLNGNRCISTEGSTVCSLRDLIWTAYDCPASPQTGFEYDEATTRGIYLPLIASAYLQAPQPCLTNQNTGFNVTNFIQVQCDSDTIANDKCTVFTAVSTAAKVIAVSFRGSESDLEILHEILDVVEPNVAFVGGGKVFAYFHHAFYLLWDGGLSAEIARLRQQYPDYKLVAVGHSLGASLASVFSTFIASQGPWQADEVKFTGFGQPRTGDADYAAAHDRLVKYSYRLVHRKDIYAHLPPPAFGNNTFSHHRFEVWYNNDMTAGRPYQLCTRPDDFSCSNNQWNFNSNDHSHYFNRQLEQWGSQGCPM